MIAHITERRRASEKTVLVVMAIRLVDAGVETQLRGVAFKAKVLLIGIRDEDLLPARIETIQVGIGILLAHVEVGEVVLQAVVVGVAEDADSEIGIVKDEAAEIAHERLYANPRRDEVVVVRKITDVNFQERLLEREEILLSGGAMVLRAAGVGIEGIRF